MEWLPSAGHRFWTILLLLTEWARLVMQRMEDLEGWMHKFDTSSSGITYSRSICCSRGPRAFSEDMSFPHVPPSIKADWWGGERQIGWYWNVEIVKHAVASRAGETIRQIGSALHQVVNMEVGRDLSQAKLPSCYDWLERSSWSGFGSWEYGAGSTVVPTTK